MSLPIFIKVKTSLDKIVQVVNQIQENAETVFVAILSKPQLDSNLVIRYQLIAGQVNHVPHQLGRNLRGWHPERIRGVGAKIWDTQDANTNPSIYLDLWTDTTVVVDLSVF